MAAIDKKNILKIAKHAFKRSQGATDKRLMHPRREWGLGVIAFAVILLVGSAMAAQSFSQFRNLDTANGNAGVNIPKYNKTVVDQVLEDYAARETAFNALVAEVVIDPEPEPIATTTEETASSSEELIGDEVE